MNVSPVPDEPLVGVDADVEDEGRVIEPDRLDPGDLHAGRRVRLAEDRERFGGSREGPLDVVVVVRRREEPRPARRHADAAILERPQEASLAVAVGRGIVAIVADGAARRTSC